MRIAVFIDGGNFYRRLKEFKVRNTGNFDFHKLISRLTGLDDITYIGYYVGKVRCEKGNHKSFILDANQQKWFLHLKSNLPNVKIILGHIQNFKGVYQEKGVDVRLALDLYKYAIEDLF